MKPAIQPFPEFKKRYPPSPFPPIPSQNLLCGLDRIKYDHVAEFERLDEQVPSLMRLWGTQAGDAFVFGKNVHATNASKQMLQLFDAVSGSAKGGVGWGTGMRKGRPFTSAKTRLWLSRNKFFSFPKCFPVCKKSDTPGV